MVGTENVLVVGSGGREHALGWKVSQSNRVSKVYFAPGNGGTSENINIKYNDISALVSFAKEKKNNLLTIVGPEEPLSLGIVDAFEKEGLRIFGPTRAAAMLEASKAFAKDFMRDAGIPTADFAIFSEADKARDYVSKQDRPLVVKADGLAAGKGVVVCDNADEAVAAIDRIMTRKEFGSAGDKVVIEERLYGEEASFIVLCDGKRIMPLASTQDHKRAFDGDKGPNTGGMGAYSPAPIVDSALHEKIVKKVMEPAVDTMRKRGTPFKGFLYAGIMVESTGEPKVLEFNARMGDPECQPIMMRMKSDLYDYIDAAVDGRLDEMPPIQWRNETSVCVIMASRGYPGNYEKGDVIEGLDSDFGPDIKVFHAGTVLDQQNRVVTNGGRVLGVTALGSDIREAIDKAYSAVRKIHWGDNGHYYRTDIARRAIGR
ncbi:MAG TPA: phosphoribosylamine--glycine ligase [Nitrososphaera sp.]|nr:phosphoribosylamine--glycine ligase [Nitrososphaera sp.]